MSDLATVSAQFHMSLLVPDGPPLPVAACMRYDAADPWAVRLALYTGGETGVVEWLLGRQLLADGLAEVVGEGDVRVWPSARGQVRVVSLAMASPSGAALFELERDDLLDFLQQTYRAVPTGSEGGRVDLDAELTLLLGNV